MNEKTRRVLVWLPVVLWCVVIYLFSAQTGPQSGALSGGISQWIASVFTPGWQTMSQVAKEAALQTWRVVIRKGAHFTEFAVLGGLMLNAWCGARACVTWRKVGLAAVGALLVAAGDEFHQMFVPARGPSVVDVMIDFSGALLGIAVVALLMMLLRRRKEKKALS